MTTVKERTQLNREVEQDKRDLTYQRDKESLEVCKLESDIGEKYRIDNMLTDGVYFVEQEGKSLVCTCPDYLNRCVKFESPIRCKHILAVENYISKKEQKKMNSHNFDPQKHLIKIKGKDYLEVKFRLHWLRLENPEWDINPVTTKIDLEKGIAIARCDIYDETGKHISAGEKMEYKKNFHDYLEKAHTGAIGRALGAAGYGTLQCAGEMDEGVEKGRIVDAPVSLGGNNGGNGKVQIQIKPFDNTKKLNGNGGTGSNGSPKASMKQVRYIKALCKDLKVQPKINVAGLSKKRACEIIEGLQKQLFEKN